MSSYEISLRDELKRRDEVLAVRLKDIEPIARKILVYTQSKFPYYTPHGFTHSEEVEICLNWIISDQLKEKFEPIEIFLLILAAWLHDCGMIAKEDEDPKMIRKVHHFRSEDYINKYYEKLKLSRQEAVILGKICKGHRVENLFDSYYNSMSIGQGIIIDVRFLTALNRLADEFDITANRVPEMIYSELNPTSKAKEEFKKHLDVIGIAYSSPIEKYKVLLTATAREPKGARVIEKLREKLQETVNTVKTILSPKGIHIDIVEMNLTNQGFIYKPIKFEINQEKIVRLLIGEHLYKRDDVAIRELIQNSIDACNTRKLLDPELSPEIIIKKLEKGYLEIEDNGVGMDYKVAKDFLSIIGDSFYISKYFEELNKNKKLNPISKWGIGILSSFLISHQIIVETKSKNSEPCKFTINQTKGYWKYEKGSLKNCGTKITLKLKDKFRDINLEEILAIYFISPEVPIKIQKEKGEIINFQKEWDIKNVIEFLPDPRRKFFKITSNEILNFETEKFKMLVAKINIDVHENLLIFNRGIFVKAEKSDDRIFEDIIICVYLKVDLIDLKISREDIKYNQKYFNFKKLIYNSLFERINEIFILENSRAYYLIINQIVEFHKYGLYQFREKKEKPVDFIEENSFFNSFFNKILYPVVYHNEINWYKIEEIFKFEEFVLYDSLPLFPLKEIELIKDYLDSNKIYVFNIWRLSFNIILHEKKYKFNIFYYYEANKTKFKTTDFLLTLERKINVVKKNLNSIIPKNIILVEFPNDFKNIILMKEFPKLELFEEKHPGLNYWGGVLLMKSLLEQERLVQMFENFNIERDDFIKSMKIISKPIVYVDSNNPIVNGILNMKSTTLEDEDFKDLLNEYFILLTYLPIVIARIRENFCFFPYFDKLERKILRYINIEVKDSIFERMGKSVELIRFYHHHQLQKFLDSNIDYITMKKEEKET